MLPTPSTSHVNYSQVYEPAEDSYLLLDTLSSPTEVRFLSTRFPENSSTPLVLEVGTGSGVVLAFATAQAQKLFGRSDVVTLGTDINDFACKATRETVKHAVSDSISHSTGSGLGCVTGDLASAIRLKSVDVLVFNPPYVPTDALPEQPESRQEQSLLSSSAIFARDSHLLALSYAGGADGMETTNRLLSQLPEILSGRGVAYVLLCAQNKPDEVLSRIRTWTGHWAAEKVSTSGKQAGWERLCVVRIWRQTSIS